MNLIREQTSGQRTWLLTRGGAAVGKNESLNLRSNLRSPVWREGERL